jgi:hypothetical protein
MLCFSCEEDVQIYVTGLCQRCHEIACAEDERITTTPVTPADGSDDGSSQTQETT